MFKVRAAVVAAALACAVAPPSHAQQSDELKEIRTQIERMKQEYEGRIQALEKRLAAAEEKAERAEHRAGQARQVAAKAEHQATKGGRPGPAGGTCPGARPVGRAAGTAECLQSGHLPHLGGHLHRPLTEL
jgi:hypothetical protein